MPYSIGTNASSIRVMPTRRPVLLVMSIPFKSISVVRRLVIPLKLFSRYFGEPTVMTFLPIRAWSKEEWMWPRLRFQPFWTVLHKHIKSLKNIRDLVVHRRLVSIPGHRDTSKRQFLAISGCINKIMLRKIVEFSIDRSKRTIDQFC